MDGFKFESSREGFIALRNEGFIQDACLAVAQRVASAASGLSGYSFTSDVRPGKARCHARAKCQVGANAQGGRKAWFDGAYSEAALAASQAARDCGGESAYKAAKKGKG